MELAEANIAPEESHHLPPSLGTHPYRSGRPRQAIGCSFPVKRQERVIGDEHTGQTGGARLHPYRRASRSGGS